jgi:hypothetical protein
VPINIAMKIVSFPHYTCGGLLCDMLNNTFGRVGNHGGIHSMYDFFGKIGDVDTVFDNFSETTFFAALENFSVSSNKNVWIGTHCWVGSINLESDLITQVISITTETHRSKMYRWFRTYHHYFKKSDPWQNLSGIDEIDKQRESAKNYIKPFARINHPKVINLEFSDVVENTVTFSSMFNQDVSHHITRWREVNHFLYDNSIWTSDAAQRFHEAEYEYYLDRRYRYE